MESIENSKKPKILNITLWTAQILLACMFIMAGFTKITTPIDELRQIMSWVNDFPIFFVRFVGIAELLGALGLILPSLLRLRPILLPLSALGLTVVMFSALIYHIVKGEYNALLMNCILGGLAFFIAWGRNPKKS